MVAPHAEPRRYDATRRRELGAISRAKTRQRILDAAGELFVERGFTGTTLAAIAERADVSVQSLYLAVGSKGDILRAVTLARAPGPSPEEVEPGRNWVSAMAAESDPRAQLAILVHEEVAFAVRAAPYWRLERQAALDDPVLAADLQDQARTRYEDQKAFIGMLHGLRPGLDIDTATDVYFALGSPQMWDLLTEERGWTIERVERWFLETMTALLLPPLPAPA